MAATTEPTEARTETAAETATEAFHNDDTSGHDQTSIIARLRSIGMSTKPSAKEHVSLSRASVLIPLLFFSESSPAVQHNTNINAGNECNRSGEYNSKSVQERALPTENDVQNTSSPKAYLLMTKRPQTMRSHAGQVCFPGGKQDEEDSGSDVRTALREAHEEIGIKLVPTSQPKPSSSRIDVGEATPHHCQDETRIDLLCILPTMESVTHLCVTPILGHIKHDHPTKEAFLSSLRLSPEEVEAAFLVPLSYFLEPHDAEEIEWRGSSFVMRTYHWQDPIWKREFKIWGLTAGLAYWAAEIGLKNTIPRELSRVLAG